MTALFKKFINIGHIIAAIAIFFILTGIYQTANKMNTKLTDNGKTLDSVIRQDRKKDINDSIKFDDLLKIVKSNTELMGETK